MAVREWGGTASDLVVVAPPTYFTTCTFASVIKCSTASLADGEWHAIWAITKDGSSPRLGVEFTNTDEIETIRNGTGQAAGSRFDYDLDTWVLIATDLDRRRRPRRTTCSHDGGSWSHETVGDTVIGVGRLDLRPQLQAPLRPLQRNVQPLGRPHRRPRPLDRHRAQQHPGRSPRRRRPGRLAGRRGGPPLGIRPGQHRHPRHRLHRLARPNRHRRHVGRRRRPPRGPVRLRRRARPAPRRQPPARR